MSASSEVPELPKTKRPKNVRGILVVSALILFALAFTLGGVICLRLVLSSRPPPAGEGKQMPVPSAPK